MTDHLVINLNMKEKNNLTGASNLKHDINSKYLSKFKCLKIPQMNKNGWKRRQMGQSHQKKQIKKKTASITDYKLFYIIILSLFDNWQVATEVKSILSKSSFDFSFKVFVKIKYALVYLLFVLFLDHCSSPLQTNQYRVWNNGRSIRFVCLILFWKQDEFRLFFLN